MAKKGGSKKLKVMGAQLGTKPGKLGKKTSFKSGGMKKAC